MLKRGRGADEADGRGETLVRWLQQRGACIDGLHLLPTHAGLGVFASRKFAVGDAIASLPITAVLDPAAELAHHPLAASAMRAGASAPFAFWLSLADGARNTEHPFHAYLASLPSDAPDPCAWSDSERLMLQGTPLAKQVAEQRQLLHNEFATVGAAVAPHLSVEDVLWARGQHLSRGFPRELAAAASAPQLDALHVEHGGHGPARVTATSETWRADTDTGAGGSMSAPAAERSRRAGEQQTGGGALAGHLGCMLPLFDMLEHQATHPVVRDAANLVRRPPNPAEASARSAGTNGAGLSAASVPAISVQGSATRALVLPAAWAVPLPVDRIAGIRAGPPRQLVLHTVGLAGVRGSNINPLSLSRPHLLWFVLRISFVFYICSACGCHTWSVFRVCSTSVLDPRRGKLAAGQSASCAEPPLRRGSSSSTTTGRAQTRSCSSHMASPCCPTRLTPWRGSLSAADQLRTPSCTRGAASSCAKRTSASPFRATALCALAPSRSDTRPGKREMRLVSRPRRKRTWAGYPRTSCSRCR